MYFIMMRIMIVVVSSVFAPLPLTSVVVAAMASRGNTPGGGEQDDDRY
jgi:hypothetical protein